jgi:hypothetical protein
MPQRSPHRLARIHLRLAEQIEGYLLALEQEHPGYRLSWNELVNRLLDEIVATKIRAHARMAPDFMGGGALAAKPLRSQEPSSLEEEIEREEPRQTSMHVGHTRNPHTLTGRPPR